MRPKSPKELHWRSVARGRLLLATTKGLTEAASRIVPRTLDPDPLTIVGRSISVRVPRQKGCDGGHAAPSAHVAHGTKAGPLACISPIRGGVPAGNTPSYIVKANGVAAPLGAAHAISYGCERETHSYWPDYVGKRHAARTFVAEAGLAEAEDKGTGDACVLARTARRLAHLQSGHVWIGRAAVLLDQHVWILMALQLQRRLIATLHALEPDVVRVWQSDGLTSIYDILYQCGRFGRRWFALEVEPATWMTTADGLQRGSCSLTDCTGVQRELENAPAFQLDAEHTGGWLQTSWAHSGMRRRGRTRHHCCLKAVTG